MQQWWSKLDNQREQTAMRLEEQRAEARVYCRRMLHWKGRGEGDGEEEEEEALEAMQHHHAMGTKDELDDEQDEREEQERAAVRAEAAEVRFVAAVQRRGSSGKIPFAKLQKQTSGRRTHHTIHHGSMDSEHALPAGSDESWADGLGRRRCRPVKAELQWWRHQMQDGKVVQQQLERAKARAVSCFAPPVARILVRFLQNLTVLQIRQQKQQQIRPDQSSTTAVPVVFRQQMEYTAAATSVQAFWRGCYYRCSLSPSLLQRVLHKRGAVLIQQWWRMHLRFKVQSINRLYC
jgi:hypothetical protein